MKSRGVIFLMLICLSVNVLAISGVSPGSYKIDFEPNLEKTFVFDFVIEGDEQVSVYADGEFSDLVSLSEEKIIGRQKVVVDLKLPINLDSPGINNIRIVAGEVVGVIKINVPYPDKFIEVELSAPDVNVGEIANMELNVFNLGEPVDIDPKIEVYKIEEEVRNIITSTELESSQLLDEKRFELEFDTVNHSAGDYIAVAVVDYGEDIASAENFFRIGEKRVDILDYTKELKENKVGKFEIEALSFWNSNIKELYAEIKVIGSDYSFVTSTVNLEAWGGVKLEGFFDTKEIYGYDKELEIILHYDAESNSKIVPFKILEGFDFVFYGVLLFILVVIVFLVWRAKIFLKKVSEHKNKVKK